MSAFDETSKWVVLQPDVLGSQQEGWQVSQAYSTGRVIELQDFESDYEVVEALQAIGFIPDNVEPWQVDIDGDEEFMYINDAANWQPLWHLQRTDEDVVTKLM